MFVVWWESAHAADPVEDARLAALEAEVAALQAEQTQAPSSPSAFNPALTAFGDVLGTVGVRDAEILPGSGPWIRSLELDLRAAVDPFANAVAILAIEQEPPALEPDPAAEEEAAFSAAAEELYVDFVALPGGLSIRAGGFRQPFGITNRAHPHDYPWPDTPTPLLAFLGEEGLNEVGATVEWHIPNPWGAGFTVIGGANAGSGFDPEGDDALPSWIGRAEVFGDAGRVDVSIGGSATGLRDAWTAGGDLLVRFRANQWRSVVLLAEVLTDGQRAGAYGALQLQPIRPLYLGGRVDWVDGDLQAGGFATFYTSEFLRFRAGAMADTEGLLTANGQLTFVWGSHPVEPYWVNK
jgi:hypothetical protein